MPIPILDNLAEVPIEHVADLVELGLKQLGELPLSRRDKVEAEVNRRKAEAEAKKQKDEHKSKKATAKAKKDASKK
jgi:hypothetical protein